jgi:hypothetical protein
MAFVANMAAIRPRFIFVSPSASIMSLARPSVCQSPDWLQHKLPWARKLPVRLDQIANALTGPKLVRAIS